MSVKMRQLVEREIATAVVDSLLAAGFALSVENGDDEIFASGDAATILAAMFLTDDERLYAEKGGKDFGWVYFVYGNDGWDVINDYTVNLEPFIGEGTAVDKVVEKYSD
jgi:hypothetical protein